MGSGCADAERRWRSGRSSRSRSGPMRSSTRRCARTCGSSCSRSARANGPPCCSWTCSGIRPSRRRASCAYVPPPSGPAQARVAGPSEPWKERGMPDVQEVFRLATQKVRPDPEALERQHRGQRRRVAQKRAAVYALVALLLVAGVAIGISTLGGDDVQPAGSGSNPPPPEAEQTLSIVDVGTGTATAFTAPADASGFDFTLDGSMVAYSDQDDNGNTQVFVADADGSNARQLTRGEGGAYGPRWSPDGSTIAYARDTADNSQIFIVRLSDGVSTRLTNEPEGAVDPGGWAPDGGSILYSTLIFSPIHHYAAISLDLTTGRTRQIVPDGSTPTWSPDGAWMAFNSWLKPIGIRLILLNADGSGRRLTMARLTLDDGLEEWSPDSTQIAFIGNTDADGSGTYVYDLATGETRFVSAGTIESWIDNDHILVS